MMTVGESLEVCDCCALMIANGDESSCRDYYGHDHGPCDVPFHTVLNGDPEERWGRYTWTCEGCGQEMLPGANVWTAAR